MKATRAREWFDEDSLWRDFYLFMFSEKRFAEAAEQVPKLLKLLKPRGRAILDLCCGPGRFSIPLAKLGFRVTGLDKTRFLLNKARAKAKRAKLTVEWVQADMRDFVRLEGFDVVLSMFTSFGYFDDKKEDEQVLANVCRSLRPGGTFLIDLMGKEILARIAQPCLCDVLLDGSRLIQRPQVVEGWTRIRNEWTLIRNGAVREFTFQNRIYSGEELRDGLFRAGFNRVKLYGSLDGEEYGPHAKRLIAVATRK